MKTKIKATGEIKELNLAFCSGTQVVSYRDSNGIYYNTHEIEIIPDQPEAPIIDWEQRRYEIAKEALQAIITSVFSNKEAAQAMLDTAKKNGLQSNEVESIMAITYADELIYQLKNTPVR